jgi:hypothetical protein
MGIGCTGSGGRAIDELETIGAQDRSPNPNDSECTTILFCLVKRQHVCLTFCLVDARFNTIPWADLSAHLRT